MTLAEREAQAFFHTYKRLPLTIIRGEGMYLYDQDGTRYLDMFAGLAVNALGYSHPHVVEAIREQAGRYIHLSNYFLQETQVRLAELLVKATGFARVFFSNSGTEAVEGAMKLARRWGSTRGKRHILSLSNAFHGRTLGALSLMDRVNYRAGFEPFLECCGPVEFNSVESLQQAVNSETLALMLEFIQGEGGIRPVSTPFVDAVRSLKEQYGFLVIADEIQAGAGRTGKFFAFEHFDITPDIVVIAKPIGGGLPLGAVLGAAHLADVLQPGMHGTTFGGNPVACAAGIAVMEEILNRGLMDNAARMGETLLSGLLQIKEEFPERVKEVRGYGLMVGMELTDEAEPVVRAVREKHHILINGTDRTVLRFLPPLIVGKEEVERTVEAVRQCLTERS